MRAARLHTYDESIPPDSLQVEKIDEPKIEGPLDVIIRIGAAGLCRTDIHIIEEPSICGATSLAHEIIHTC